MTEEGPGRESRAFSVRGEARVARISRSLLPDIQKSWDSQTRPTVARMICHPPSSPTEILQDFLWFSDALRPQTPHEAFKGPSGRDPPLGQGISPSSPLPSP